MATFSFLDEPKYSLEEIQYITSIIRQDYDQGIEEFGMELIPINVKNMIKDIKINIEKHKKRNMNQYHLCPETLNQMELLVELKLFAKWGRTGKTGTHNMYNDKEDTIEGRWKAFLSKEHGDNVDYRVLKDQHQILVEIDYKNQISSLKILLKKVQMVQTPL